MNRILTAAGLALVLASVGFTQTLNLGDPAPAMTPTKWVQGDPVTKLDEGKVNVVEFWATWCGPCKVSIPHLTELAHKYGDKVTFTGVSVWESRGGPFADDTYDKVSKFVTDMGPKMDYRVAADGPEATMAKNWMTAAGQNGIPTAFVVGGDGKVLWIGHPMAGLEEALDKVLAGTYDIKAEAARQQKAKDDEKAFEAMMKPVSDAYRAGKYDLAVAELDKVMAKDPKYATQFAMTKYSFLLKANEPKAYAYAREMSNGIYKDNAMALNQIAWLIVDEKTQLKKPDYKTAILIAEKAVKVSKSADPAAMDTLAYAYYKNGDVKKAVTIEKQAIALLDKDPQTDAATKKEYADRLSLFQSK